VQIHQHRPIISHTRAHDEKPCAQISHGAVLSSLN
jgi:hypothetical protein